MDMNSRLSNAKIFESKKLIIVIFLLFLMVFPNARLQQYVFQELPDTRYQFFSCPILVVLFWRMQLKPNIIKSQHGILQCPWNSTILSIMVYKIKVPKIGTSLFFTALYIWTFKATINSLEEFFTVSCLALFSYDPCLAFFDFFCIVAFSEVVWKEIDRNVLITLSRGHTSKYIRY